MPIGCMPISTGSPRVALPDGVFRLKFSGPVFRAHNPEWAWAPDSGEGARRHGGRFNRPGRAALYTALTPLTAIREASPLGRPMEPLTLCEYDVACDDMLDLRDDATRVAAGVAWEGLSAPDWEMRMLRGDPVPSQDMAERLIADGVAGIIVPSFARTAGPAEANAVFWRWSDAPPYMVRVIDTQGRLPRDRASWL